MKEARLKKRLTRRELAAMVGCSESTIAKIEYGRGNPSLKLAAKLSTILGKSVSRLFLPN